MSKVGTIAISLFSKNIIKLYNIAFAPNCDLNLIFFSQLLESNIIYHDKSMRIIPIKKDTIIVYIKQEYNLFFLDLMTSGVIIIIKN